MADTGSAVPAGETQGTKPSPKAEPVAESSQPELGIEALARGILSREVRPRISDIRRLAEAVLAKGSVKKPKKAKALAGGKDKSKPDAKSAKKAGKRKKKLAKIPGQKAKK